MTDELKRKVCEVVHAGERHGQTPAQYRVICDRVAAMLGVRCQHQAPDASLDCDSAAVLCEHHGGHDVCAVDVMQREIEIDRLRACLDAALGALTDAGNVPVDGIESVANGIRQLTAERDRMRAFQDEWVARFGHLALEVARIVSDLSKDEAALEGLDDIEQQIFGERVECPHGCGSLNLPGASACWGCEEEIT